MLKASSLYLVIMISLIISVICSALIIAAYLYYAQYQAKFRADKLQSNVNSGINILLATRDSVYKEGKSFSLFDNQDDSVFLRKENWGAYDICTVKAFTSTDTVFRVFSVARTIDSTKWSALYLIDEDRPISVSGKTRINGNAYLPKAGIRPAYVDNEAYTGDPKIVSGTIRESARKLPPLQESRLGQLEHYFGLLAGRAVHAFTADSIGNSFRENARIFSLGKRIDSIEHVSLRGKIILCSDTTLLIDGSVSLKNVLVFARAIVIKNGFHGQCQLFARDSISIQRDCSFDYPSVIGLIRTTSSTTQSPQRLNIGENSRISGLVFTYEKDMHQLPPIISMDKNSVVTGQLYSQGILNLRKNTTINGSVYTNRFLYKSDFTMYENYLINAAIDGPALSRYYLVSDLVPAARKQNCILQWLERK